MEVQSSSGGRIRVAVAITLVHLAASFGAIVFVTMAYTRVLGVTNATSVALTFLLVVLVVAATSRFWVAVATSIAAVLCLNFFVLPPVGTWTIADPQNWVALFVFLAVSLVAGNLSSAVRAKAQEALERRDEMARLFALSRDVMLMTDSREAISALARAIARRFDLQYAAICLPHGETWEVSEAGSMAVDLDRQQLSRALAGEDYRQAGIRLVPLRLGARPIGLLAAAGRLSDSGTLDAIAGVAAIAIERVQFLDERKAADLARQSEELKSALLASLGHDLRTPLTAIRVAAGNLSSSWANDEDRQVQSELILVEVERLHRLFQNILDMAKLDAGGVSAERQWVDPFEVVDAARTQVEHTLKGRRVHVRVGNDRLVRLDPRLTAAALAHLLENAAQYSPAETPIDVEARPTDEGLLLTVRDRGPGIATEDLPRLFERFYRGGSGRHRTSGTGMGLSIARGVLAVEQGRVWAENCEGGAKFTIVVPGATKTPSGAEAAIQ